MPYIGKSPVGGGFHKLDNLTASATATYALTLGSAAYYPETANQLLVSLNGVIQAPQDSFTVSGSNLVFDSALTSNDSIDFVVALGDVLGVGSVSDGAITTAKIGNGAVTAAKLAAGVQGVAGISSSSTSGTALSIDANNIVTTPARPAFSVYQSSNIDAQDYTSDTKVSFDTKDFDIGNNVTLNNSAVFTAPVDGIYHITCSVMINATEAANYLSLKMFIDDAAVNSANDLSYRYLEDNQGGAYQTANSSGLIQLTANQTVTPYLRILDDSSVTLRDGARFFGYLVG